MAMSAAISLAVAAPVVDINDQTLQNSPPGGSESDASGGMFYQLQLLQEEIRQLRGMLEEQSYQIRQLQKRQSENYSDLDGRLSALAKSFSLAPAVSNPSEELVGSSTSTDIRNQQPPGPQQSLENGSTESPERMQYNAAYALLKARKLDKSLSAFREFLVAFPDSSYAPNAYYWIGEIYLVKGELKGAATEFSRVVENHPAHRKAPDARYKLGTVFYQLGEREKARKHLETAAAGTGSSARLAERYLKDNF